MESLDAFALNALEGLDAQALRRRLTPTVPPGGARLRFAFSAAHAEADVDRLAARVTQLVSSAC